MTVEERRGSIVDDERMDQFPVGIHVLAVDDDLTCLRVLESLLRLCNYHVTTTTQAVMALKMLRENKNKFDLVISDVYMPDMDGFKLLELVGLEMDLPVIMLSGNSDPKLVMKGITHGACDYLLKPVRIEELKNIWQHLIRRKFDSKDPYNSDNAEKPHQGTGEGGQGPAVAGQADQNGKFNRKRKDQNENDDEEFEKNIQENEDPLTQKKPRVVWSVELHRKFVAAVNQLGVDKAVPKKILDLMNVDNITRENVASHLQKYRLYLKRISCVASQQANMVAAFGGRDPSYLRMRSLDGLGDFHSLTGSGNLSNPSLTSFLPGGMLGRLNTPAALGLHGVGSSGMIQLGRAQNSSISVNNIGKLQQVIPPGNQNGNLLKGMPTSFELDQLQQNKCISHIGEFSVPIDDPTIFPLSSGFLDTRVTIGSSNNTFLNVSNNQLLLQGQPQQAQSQEGLANQSSVRRMSSFNSEPFEIGVGVSSHLPDQARCNDNWQGSIPLTGFPSNPSPLSNPFSHVDPSSCNLRENISSMAPRIGSSSLNVSPTSVVSSPLQDLRRDAQGQAGSIGINFQHDNLKVSNLGGRVGQDINYTPHQKGGENKQNYTHNSNLIFSSLNSPMPVHGLMGPLGQNLGQENAVCSREMDLTMINQSNCSTPFLMQQNGLEKSAMGTMMSLKDEYLLEQNKSQGGIMHNICGSLEDLMNAMIKQEHEEVMLKNGDVGCNIFPFRTCM